MNDELPCIMIVWDPELVTEEEYAQLVKALGDVVRQHGGRGVNLLSQSYTAFRETCPECYGEGVARTPDGEDHCGTCDGSGRVPQTIACPECGGHGLSPCHDPLWGEALTDCPRCNGTGLHAAG